MLDISYKPSFLRAFKLLEPGLQDEVLEKIESFKNIKNHRSLKVHKLHGRLKGCFSFSVNYKIRIVFQFETKRGVSLLAIEDHDVYR